MRAMVSRNNAAPALSAEKRRHLLPVRGIRIHRLHQHQPPQMQLGFFFQTFRSRHHRNRAAMRGSQQIKGRNPQLLR